MYLNLLMTMIDIFIPSYHRPSNVKTAKYFIKNGYNPNKIHVVLDDAADDIEEYKTEMDKLKCKIHIFNMQSSIDNYDYVHKAYEHRRSTGQCINMIYDIAKSLNLNFFLVMDDDTNGFEKRPFQVYDGLADFSDVVNTFLAVKDLMIKHHIGSFALSQTGDMFARFNTKVLRKKTMNTSFYNMPYINKGRKGVLDNDTSEFVNIMNEGYFTGSLASGIVLKQTASAKAKGGLTDVYNQTKLLSKSLVTPIQFPSRIIAEKQTRNGGRLHHKINYRYLSPCLIKGKRNNLKWDAYPEDVPFTNIANRK